MKNKRLIAVLTSALFLLNQLVLPEGLAATAGSFSPSETRVPKSFQLEIPSELGTVETIFSGDGPTLIHLQEAHGNYEAQKKIEGILHYLKDNYGMNLILLEGDAFKLNPELLRLLPSNNELTYKILDGLAKFSLATGPELFFAKEKEAEAYGIEDLKAYVDNGGAFARGIKQKEKTKEFLDSMNLQIVRLTSPYLNKDLRYFLNRIDDYDDLPPIVVPGFMFS